MVFGILLVPIAISAQQQYEIPSWVKGVAGFWAEDKISDNDFGEGLTFLIENEIIQVPKVQELQSQVDQLKSENKNLKQNIANLENENSNLKFQINELKSTPSPSSPSTYTEPKTTPQNTLNYPKITKRIDGKEAQDITTKLTSFSESLSQSQKKELIYRSVDESDFIIVVIFSGEWNLIYTEYDFEFQEFEGRGQSLIPFDCSHNSNYIYSIVGTKVDESGKITVGLFKNGVLIGVEQSEKPFGMAVLAGVCDEPYL